MVSEAFLRSYLVMDNWFNKILLAPHFSKQAAKPNWRKQMCHEPRAHGTSVGDFHSFAVSGSGPNHSLVNRIASHWWQCQAQKSPRLLWFVYTKTLLKLSQTLQNHVLAGMFFIRILGPILGFLIGSFCNRLYYNLDRMFCLNASSSFINTFLKRLCTMTPYLTN